MANVPAILGWWETHESREASAISVVETEDATVLAKHLKQFDAETYSAIMSRGPALPGGFHGSLTTRPHSSAYHHQNGQSSSSAVADSGPRALAAPAPKPKASPPALREKPEARSEPRQSGEPRMLNCRGRIQDISHTGISLRSEAPPPEGQSVWVRLDGLEPSDWVEGSLVSAARGEPGNYHVRIKFHQACPYDFFKATVYSRPEK